MPAAALTVALAQIAPVWLDRVATTAKIANCIADAARAGARLVAFGEGILPGYPFWLEHTDAARFESPLQKSLFSHYASEAVDIARGDLQPICEAAREGHIWIVLGCIERSVSRGHSLYCALVTIDDRGDVRNVHRKLMPTYEERLVWASGDGHGLRCFALDGFMLGGLNCWENWMPLARAALYAQGEDVHVATWPGNWRNTESLTRHIAREGRCYALSVSGLMRRSDIGDHLPHASVLREAMPEVVADGGSCIAAPTGEWLLAPCVGEEKLLLADLDIALVRAERQNFDVAGHYARPDVLELHVDRRRFTGARFTDADSE